MSSAFGAGGQRCLAGSVAVLVGTRDEQDRALDALAEAAAADLGVGPGDEDGVEVCPLVGPEARERIAAAAEAADGGEEEVVLDGRRDAGPGGSLIGPSIVETTDTRVRPRARGAIRAAARGRAGRRSRRALEFANGSRYGNAGSIFTTSGGAARAYRWGAEAGMLGVNVGVAAPVAWFPFSGWKDSIDGDLHANGADAVEFYTRKKVVTSRW